MYFVIKVESTFIIYFVVESNILLHRLPLRRLGIFLLSATVVLCISCTKQSSKSDSQDSAQTVEDYHADNDIAMTVSSVVDAIRVGEPLDTIDYNFEGILTDGQGRPLYSTIQGSPGTWDVDVLSPTDVVIKNIDVGDLLPEDLEIYITQALQLSAMDRIDDIELHDEDDTEIKVYDFKGGFLRIETRKGTAANGLEGPLMRIIASKQLNI